MLKCLFQLLFSKAKKNQEQNFIEQLRNYKTLEALQPRTGTLSGQTS